MKEKAIKMTEQKRPVGRPSKYKPEYANQAFKLCLLGSTDLEMADFFEVNIDTIYEWKNEFQEFSDAIKNAKVKADSEVASKLYNRASGYDYIEDQVVKVKSGKDMEDAITVSLRRHVPPDPTSIIFWLKNRNPNRWRDKQTTEVTGENGAPIDHSLKVTFEKPKKKPDAAE